MGESDLLTTTDVAKLTGRAVGTAKEAIRLGHLPSVGRTELGRPLVTREAALAWHRQAKRWSVSRSTPAWTATEGMLREYGPASPSELAELLAKDAGNVRKHLAILAARGAAERLSDGQWVLTAPQRQGAA